MRFRVGASERVQLQEARDEPKPDVTRRRRRGAALQIMFNMWLIACAMAFGFKMAHVIESYLPVLTSIKHADLIQIAKHPGAPSLPSRLRSPPKPGSRCRRAVLALG